MKATGIVRRIDDLGRIVVPKEIRRTLRIREGDPLEIFTDRDGEIILKKYSPIGELGQFAGEYAESLAQTTGYLVLVTDCDHVIAASGSGMIPKENLLRRQHHFWDGRWNSKINSEMRRGGKIKKAKIFPLLIYYWKNKKNHIQ